MIFFSLVQVLEDVIITGLDGIMPFKSKKIAKKNCRAKFYEAKIKHLKSYKPTVWWKEEKNLSGFAPPASADPLVDFQHVVGGQGEPPKDSQFPANLINSSFLAPMSVFETLSARTSEHNNAAPAEPRPRPITEYSVLQKLRILNPNKASGPDKNSFLASQR